MMLRILSNTCFGLALGATLLLKLCEVPVEWVGFAVFCVGLTAILTNLMLIRFLGLGGIAGLSIVFHNLAGNSTLAASLIFLTAGLLGFGVFLAFSADLSHAGKEKNKEPSDR
jgi:hypothetical protein